jgi:tRNA threonylcarbamoyladenosine biosynthesis protein TsaB
MLLLVTDTSGKNGSVALARAGEGSKNADPQVIESVPLAGGTFSAQLVPQIAGLLAKHGFAKTDIGAFVVVSGPGSFTGLRVGLAAIKALAEILQKAIVPVSLLEVLAVANSTAGRVLAVLDAGRGEVYAGEYEVAGEAPRLRSERLLSRDELGSSAQGFAISTTDRAVEAVARQAGLSVFAVEAVSAAMIARLGWRKLQAGETVTPEQLEANYIRRSDAEISPKPASGS